MSSATIDATRSSSGFKAPDEMEIAKTSLKKRNVYDYNKMLENFQLQDTIVRDRRKRLKHLVEVNKQYHGQVESMKLSKIQSEQDKIDKTKKELEEREKKYKTQQEANEKEREEKRIRMNRDGKEESAHRKYIINLTEQEAIRLKEAERTRNRLNLFTEVSLEKKLERKKNYEDKLRQSNEYHMKNLKIRDANYERLLKERDEKAFQKYTSHYFFRKNQLANKHEKQSNQQKHLEMVQEILEKEEEKREKDRQRFLDKLEKMDKQRQMLEEQKNALCEMRIEEYNRKYAKTKKNLEEEHKLSKEFRENTLEYQKALVFKGKGKQDATLNNRYLARENIVLTQMETEKKINKFNRDINKILDQSIMKKSNEQRQQIYKDMLKAEADKKKREMEEKKFEKK